MDLLKKPVLSRKSLILLLLILSLHLFMRLYHATQNLGFGHDEDLSAWIAKDIIIDHNLRLIGQETSIGSLFIGPIFYYLQALYFAIFNMDPLAGLYMTLTISIVMLFSIYYVFKRFFGESAGLIGALIYASSQALANHDSWIVPTQPTLLWTTWYLYILFYITKENNPKIFILLGILFGLIWHIHIAFAPLLLLIALAIYLNKKNWLNRKNLLNKYSLIGALLFLFLMLPFFVFEARHNLMQLKGLVNSLSEDRNASEGRLFKIYDGASWSFMNILHEVKYTGETQIRVLQAILLLLLIGMLLYNHKTLGKKAWLIYSWIILMILAQLLSKRAISEYYFTNLTILSILTLAVTLNSLTKYRFLKPAVFILIGSFVFLNIKNVIATPANPEGYLMRKRLINYIGEDAKKNNYPCIGINYMTSPGKSGGFRYFFWWNNLNLVTPGNDVPVYSLLNPAAMAENEITYRAGVLAVIPPKNPKINPEACKDPNRQLLPLWGFNN